MKKFLLLSIAMPIFSAYSSLLEYVCEGQDAAIVYRKGPADQKSMTLFRHTSLYIAMVQEGASNEDGFELSALVNDIDYGPQASIRIEHPPATLRCGETYEFKSVLKLDKSGSTTEAIDLVCTVKKT